MKLFRSLASAPLWTKEPFTRGQAWVDLLMLANFKPGHLRVRGNRVRVGRGQIGWSAERLAARWQWSRGKVNRFLQELENEQQIEQHKSFVTTVTTITNYNRYQKHGTANGTADGQQADTKTDTTFDDSDEKRVEKRTADGQQKSTGKSSVSPTSPRGLFDETDSRRTADSTADGHQNGALSKKGITKKGRRKGVRTAFVPPTVDEVAAYCRERKNGFDPQAFIDSYERGGWVYGKNQTPMRDWKAAVRTWEANRRKDETPAESRVATADDLANFDLVTGAAR